MATSDEFDSRNWIWSTWIRRPNIYGVNSRDPGMRGGTKAASTMSMIFRKVAGKMRREKGPLNARCPYSTNDLDANENKLATTATAAVASLAASTATSAIIAPSQKQVHGNRDFPGDQNNNREEDLELNRGTPSSIDFNASDIGELGDSKESNDQPAKNYEKTNKEMHKMTLKRCHSSRTSKEKKIRSDKLDPYYFKLDTCSGLAGVKATRPPGKAQPTPPKSIVEYSKVYQHSCNDPSNCNSGEVLRQQELQQLTSCQHTNNDECHEESNDMTIQQISGNIVEQQSQRQDNNSQGRRDSIYGICFTSDLPYSSLVDVMSNIRLQHSVRPQQRFQHLQQPLQHYNHPLHYRPHYHHYHHRHHQQTCLNHHDDHIHHRIHHQQHLHNNDVEQKNNLLHSPHHHHDHHNHNHYYHLRGNHHHHHHKCIFEKPDLVTETPPPLPVKCLTPNRCPACSRGNLSVATSPSAIL